MSFINYIVEQCNTVGQFFYSIYLKVFYWYWPFKEVDTFFLSLSQAFYNLAWYFYYFGQWLDSLALQISQLPSFTQIYAYFQSYFNMAQTAYNWVFNAFSNIASNITTWWNASNNPIRLYIDTFNTWVHGQIDLVGSWISWFYVQVNYLVNMTIPQIINSVQELWNIVLAFVGVSWQAILEYIQAFWDSTIFPALQSILQTIAGLHFPTWEEIGTYILSFLPGIVDILNWWGEFWGDVKEFFADPSIFLWKHWDFGWILASLTDIINALVPLTPEEETEKKRLEDIGIAIDEAKEIMATEELKERAPQNLLISTAIYKITAKLTRELEAGGKD